MISKHTYTYYEATGEPLIFGVLRPVPWGAREGTTGSALHDGVTPNFMPFDRGDFWVPICQNLSILRIFFSNRSKFLTSAATPLVLIPFVRNRVTRRLYGQSPHQDSGLQGVRLRRNLNAEEWNSPVHREFVRDPR